MILFLAGAVTGAIATIAAYLVGVWYIARHIGPPA
jgi:hypothetical protein